MEGLPYRGTFGDARPPEAARLWLPPQPMPSHHRGRPLKAWRYVGFYSPELMLCIGAARVGPLRQSFWALWDREARRWHERTLIGRRDVHLAAGRAEVESARIRIELELDEVAGIETISPSGRSYAWTRKQGGIAASGSLFIDRVERRLDGRALIDDSAGYHQRHTQWRWCAGIGRGADGQRLAWNLVEGVHDAPEHSERTLWVDGEPHEVPPSAWDGLTFQPEAERARRDNLILIRSSYRQPFGTFSGEVAGQRLADGYGVTESHDAWW